jgi:hypothetical protein
MSKLLGWLNLIAYRFMELVRRGPNLPNIP